MGKVATISRRTFLVGSAAIAGGVAFGVYSYRKPHDNPLLDDLPEGAAAFNPWVKIDKDGIVLIAPHADIGQGVASMQAALIAEELDVEFGQFSIDLGKPSAAYFNTALGPEMAPFAFTDQSAQAQRMRGLMGALGKLMGLQGTGGSSSTPDSFEKLRRAGAVARETLKTAAAQQTGVAIEQLKTANGAVQLPDGTSIQYTELAATAAGIEPVTDVKLRDPSQWRMVGKEMQRLDIVPKSTGTLKYGIDLFMDGMLNAAVKTNPRQGGGMISYDAGAAESMPGVKQIVPITDGVAVLATNTWLAIQAVNKIKFEWGTAPYPAEQEDHWQEVADSFVEDRLDNEWRHDGDVDSALQAGKAIEAEYRAPYLAHAPLEPLNAIIQVADERVDVWASHQMPRFTQQQVAAVTGHSTGDVHFHNQYAGGSFGHRLEFEQLKQAAEIAKVVRNTPIKLTFSREEDFAHDFPRQIAMSRASGTVSAGKVDAYDLKIASVSSSASQSSRLGIAQPGPDNQIPAGAWDAPYAIPNFRVRGYRVPELAPTSSWRSVGASTGGFFMDGFLDELIHAAGADPMEERIRLMDHDVSRKVLEAVAEMSGWGKSLAPNKGMGVAFVPSFGVPIAEVVEVTNTDRGIRIDNVWVAADVGTVVDPINFDNHVKGAVVWGLGHAINSEITYSDGMAQQLNYHAFEGMRLYQCPEIHVRGLENSGRVRGIGEPPVPPAAPALANAIFAATGKRLREMPFNKHIDFV